MCVAAWKRSSSSGRGEKIQGRPRVLSRARQRHYTYTRGNTAERKFGTRACVGFVSGGRWKIRLLNDVLISVANNVLSFWQLGLENYKSCMYLKLVVLSRVVVRGWVRGEEQRNDDVIRSWITSGAPKIHTRNLIESSFSRGIECKKLYTYS